jgi:hypothetical protein
MLPDSIHKCIVVPVDSNNRKATVILKLSPTLEPPLLLEELM